MKDDQLEEFIRDVLGVRQCWLRPNGWIHGTCPMHAGGGETRPSFGILTTADHHPFSCFVCGSGSLLSLTMKVRKLNSREALELILKYGGYDEGVRDTFDLPDPDELARLQARKKEVTSLEYEGIEGWPLYSPYEGKRIKFLKRKLGFTEKHIIKCRLGFDKIQKRITYPWIWNNKLVGITGRAVKDDFIKTKPYFGFQKTKYLYMPSRKNKKLLVLVEGEKDAVSVARCYCEVASPGFNKITERQANLIVENYEEIIIYPDNDEGGRVFIERVALKLRDLKLYLAIGKSKDPGEASVDEVRNTLKNVRPIY